MIFFFIRDAYWYFLNISRIIINSSKWLLNFKTQTISSSKTKRPPNCPHSPNRLSTVCRPSPAVTESTSCTLLLWPPTKWSKDSPTSSKNSPIFKVSILTYRYICNWQPESRAGLLFREVRCRRLKIMGMGSWWRAAVFAGSQLWFCRVEEVIFILPDCFEALICYFCTVFIFLLKFKTDSFNNADLT